MKPFHVVIPDPWAFSRGSDKPAPESRHATLGEAQARCREIVAAELCRRFEDTASWTQALRSYLDSKSVVYVGKKGRAVAFFEDFARAWVVERLAEDWPALIERIVEAKPEIPRGWFRWLHHTFCSRYPAFVELGLEDEWRAVEEVTVSHPERLDAVLFLNVEAHAWEVGCLGLRRLAEACWEKLTPRAKGRLLAGLSTRDDMMSWIQTRLAEADLSAENVLELACNAVWNEDAGLFQAAMERGPLSMEVERMEPFEGGPSRKSEWTKHVNRLSNRIVDMALEACVVRGWAEGARVALQFGANPDLPVWVLERNYNEHHSALSFSIKNRNSDVTHVLLQAGARPAGDMGDMPLFLAIRNRNDSLAGMLIDSGLGFTRGDKPDWLASSRPGDNIEWERSMFFNCRRENIERARRLEENLPLVHASAVAWFYQGDGQGGRYSTMLSPFLYHDEVERLRWYAGRGLPLTPTLPDMAILLSSGAYDCLRWMMSQWNTPPRVMWRIRREIPDFGTQGRLWRVRADARRVGVLSEFDPGDQEPLVLPDGGRLWVDLQSIAGGDHDLGPVTSGTLWVRICEVTARRRPDRVVLRDVRQIWDLRPEPANDHQLRDLLQVVKEVDGMFLSTGLTMDKVWWQDCPGEGGSKDWIKRWTEGPAWERLRPQVMERLRAQRAGNATAPAPLLEKDELDGFPHVFHPWLRRMENGRIELDEEAAAAHPQIIARHRAWSASMRGRERDWRPDERVVQWPHWDQVPPDLRPWFGWDELFNRPGPIHLQHANPYEKAMIQRAVRWWNNSMIAGMRNALGGK